MKQTTIRKMRSDDMVSVLSILDQWNMAPVAASDEMPDPERSTINVDNTFVAVEDDTLVGVGSYLDVCDEMAETASLAVEPRCKGQGIGFRLQVARLKEMKARGFKRVRTETDRPESIQWYIRKFGYRKVGKNPKKHAFSLTDVHYWTVLELDLDTFNESA